MYRTTCKDNCDFDQRFIEVTYSGIIEMPEIENAMAGRAKLAQAHDINKHLIDCSQVSGVPALPELYRLAENIQGIISHPIQKAAMVMPECERAAVDLFYFTLKSWNCCNIGIELFNNQADAVRWLRSSDRGWLSK